MSDRTGGEGRRTPRDTIGHKTPEQLCPGCGRDLSELPLDITNCPYCGRELSTSKAEPPKPPEASQSRRRLSKSTKITAILGLLIVPVSFVLAISSSAIMLNGVLVGFSIAIASGIARTFEKGLILRHSLGALLVAVPIIPMFFGGPAFLPLMFAPGIMIAVFLLASKRRGVRSSAIVLLGALAYAGLWIVYGGSFLDGSWWTVLPLLWYSRVPSGAHWPYGLGFLVFLWTMQVEKVLALTVGILLLLTALFAGIRAPSRKAAAAAIAFSLLPMLLLMPPARESIEGETILKVTISNFYNTPISKLEVDLGRNQGLLPPLGGIATTDEEGTATFRVKPGSYVVYFDERWLPSDFEYQTAPCPVNVSEGEVNELTIVLHYANTPIAGEAVFRATVLAVDCTPISGLEVDMGKEPGPPPEGGKVRTDQNGTATFQVKPGSYVVYFNQLAFPQDLSYPSELYYANVSEGRPNELTIFLNYSQPQQTFSSQGVSIWLTAVNDPDATRLRRISPSGTAYIWVQGRMNDSSEFQVFGGPPDGAKEQMGPASRLDPGGRPVPMGTLSGCPSTGLTFEVRMNGNVVASVTIH